ncbi:hypothetical protein BU24DRAFT_165037 [Aaosphaeria arxii CBS 175.79]|uniref:Zn(2)-C6 fungal-type domain-containing protein n=1 Tax=Aaosphaeria arxii CBS 175.79 TaxID=1450172 RepID=A0A6A5XYR2_9PLEO|nr:uncharacterized protein BU24DRAFT_165037 [Aaosphaeria arxii CBS 175.79]KAF2018116.1 hypothetical protein BU24DRAFT_165037 [Aaosphaeria arxii CBS 175.79]
MSYRGKPSKGCDSCRSRKIKCDEKKPTCDRCNKSGLDCRYRNIDDLLFKNQTTFAAQKAESSWRKRSKPQPPPSTNASTNEPPGDLISFQFNHYSSSSKPLDQFIPSDSPLQFNDLITGVSMEPGVRRMAYERFLYDFITSRPDQIDDEGPPNALFDFIPMLFEATTEGSCFSTIVDALSYANFGVRCNYPEGQALAEQNWVKALRLLQTDLKDEKLASSDETLAAIYLMGIYDNIASDQLKGIYEAHKNGATALLQLRTVEDFCGSPISTRLYEACYTQMLIGSFIGAKEPIAPISNIIAARKTVPTAINTSGIDLMNLIHNVTSLHAQWHLIKASPSPPQIRQELVDILRQGLDLDAELQIWETRIPRSLRYDSKPNLPETRGAYDRKWINLMLSSSGAPNEIHSFPSLRRAFIYTFFRTSRMFLLRDMLEIMNCMLALPPPDPQPEPSNFNIATLILEDPSPQTTLLNTTSLRIHHRITTTHLTDLVEKACSAIIGSFTVPIPGRVDNDGVMGVRGYINFWCLGVISAVLRSGFIPQSSAPSPPPPSTSFSPPRGGSSPAPSPAMFVMPPENRSHFYFHAAMLSRQEGDFPPLPPISAAPARSGFDIEVEDAGTLGIDVEARREWVQRVLYYVGAHLGNKKALGLLGLDEGARERCQGEVERMVGGL